MLTPQAFSFKKYVERIIANKNIKILRTVGFMNSFIFIKIGINCLYLKLFEFKIKNNNIYITIMKTIH